jgi:hypothetical protein
MWRVSTSIVSSCGRGRRRRPDCRPATWPLHPAQPLPTRSRGIPPSLGCPERLFVRLPSRHPGGARGVNALHRSGRAAGAHRSASPSVTSLPAVRTPAVPTCATGPRTAPSLLDSQALLRQRPHLCGIVRCGAWSAMGLSAFAQFIRICRWLKLIYKMRLAPLENAPFSTPWARKRCSVAQRFRQY